MRGKPRIYGHPLSKVLQGSKMQLRRLRRLHPKVCETNFGPRARYLHNPALGGAPP